MSEATTSQEGKTYPPDSELSKTANARPEMKDQDLEEFWDQQAKDKISWFEPYDTVLDWNLPYAKWFVGGKLNACYNCVDRHVENGKGDKVALHVVPDDGPDSSEARDITFSQLQEQVVKFANGLKKLGVGKGVPVGIYMQMIPEAVVAMLACARLGAPHTVVFGGFSGKAVAERCNDLECKVLITQDEAMRGGKAGAQKTNADEGLDAGPTTVEKVVVVKRSGADIPMGDRDVYLDDLVADESGDARELPVRADGVRGPAVPALHLGLDRASPRASCTPPAATWSARRRPTTWSSTSRTTRSTGARPTSAGSPATATSSTGRWPTAAPRCSSRASPATRTRTSGGGPSTSTG